MSDRKKRKIFHWPAEVKALLQDLTHSPGHGSNGRSLSWLVNRLATLTGFPRDACLRYLHKSGVDEKRKYRPWTKPEQQKLLDIIEKYSVEEVAKILQRSPGSIRSMLYRLGEGCQRGREWFTPYSLSEALHIRAEEVQRWVDQGWLKSRVVETAALKKQIIDPDDFTEFVKQYGSKVVGRRLNIEGLRFIQNFVFPSKHAHLLPLRKSFEMTTRPAKEDPDALEDSA